MILRNIKIQKKTRSIVVSADFMMSDEAKPQQIFFEIEKEHQKALKVDATSFVAALLIPCMMKNEEVIVEGSTLSEKFLQNTNFLMKKLNKWNKDFHIIKITSRTKIDSIKKPVNGEFFTAGVDSFYTYLKAKREGKKISHFLFVHGFDIELENKSFFTSVRQGIEKLAQEENVEVISLKSNAKKIIERYIEWDWGHGGALAAVALLLRNELTNVYIAGALRHDQLFPYGTHPEIDHLWGTESLTLIHDGNEYDRLDKVMHVVGKSKLALTHLRVCNQNLKGKYNCSKCFKCLWTMMTLECAGALKKAKTFDSGIDLEAVKKMRYTFARNYHLAGVRVIKELQKQNKRKDLQDAVRESLRRSKHLALPQKISLKVAEIDKKYNKRRLYMTIFAVNKDNDRNTVFKLLARQGIIK